jgi:putative tryptophan/tyrosine transport system substrate-binding protein
MRRREFIALIGGSAVAWPLVARAQQVTKVPRIGLLSPFSSSDTALWHQAFRQGLRDLGWVEGKTIIIEYRYADGRNERLPELSADLVHLKVDVIVTAVTNDALAAKNATREIPIVMAAAGDPVATGIVESLGRPGGNITGLSQMNAELIGKRLELLKEIVPMLSPVAVLWNPDDPISVLSWNEIQIPARNLGVEVHSLEVRSPVDLDKALEEAARTRVGALAIMPNPVFVTNLKRIADFAAQNRLPSIFHLREFADAGGLVSYGVDRSDLFRRAATYVDKILKGANTADLPIEQPTKFELVINLRAARALGIIVPPSLLARADEVVE